MKTAAVTAADVETVEEAEQQLAAAEQAEQQLADRVRDLDPQVSADDLDEASRATKWRRLLLDGARRKAEKAAAKAAEQARARRFEDAAALVEKQADRAPVADAYDRARAALVALLAAADDHDQAVTDAARMLRSAGAGPMTRYEQVEHDGYVTNEPRRVAATRTAPTVDPTTDALAIGDDTRHRIGAARLLAVLVADVAAGVAVDPGQPAVTRAPIEDQAHRHRDTVRAFLAAAKAGEAK